jgi:hypothetical protein
MIKILSEPGGVSDASQEAMAATIGFADLDKPMITV